MASGAPDPDKQVLTVTLCIYLSADFRVVGCLLTSAVWWMQVKLLVQVYPALCGSQEVSENFQVFIFWSLNYKSYY